MDMVLVEELQVICYFPDAPLIGPQVGDEFLLKVGKRPWTSKALASVVSSIRRDLFELIKKMKTKTFQITTENSRL